MRLLIIVGLLFLTGCAQLWSTVTPEEHAAMARQAAEAKLIEEEARIKRVEAHTQKLISQHRPMCTQLGFKEGTPDFGNCVLRLYETDRNIAAQEDASRNSAIDGAVKDFQKSLQPKPTTTTNCYSYGNSINCTSR